MEVQNASKTDLGERWNLGPSPEGKSSRFQHARTLNNQQTARTVDQNHTFHFFVSGRRRALK